MGKAIDALSEAQRASFRAGIERLGLSPDKLTHHEPFVTGPGPTILSGNPKISKLPPTLIPVETIADLKRLVGIPDDAYKSGKLSDRAIDYPPELPAHRLGLIHSAKNLCDLRDQLTLEEQRALRRAAETYVQGDSAKVHSYEKILNALHFPAQVAVFTGDSIVVKPGEPLILEGPIPVVVDVGSIIVEKGGQIIVRVEAKVITQIFDAQ